MPSKACPHSVHKYVWRDLSTAAHTPSVGNSQQTETFLPALGSVYSGYISDAALHSPFVVCRIGGPVFAGIGSIVQTQGFSKEEVVSYQRVFSLAARGRELDLQFMCPTI